MDEEWRCGGSGFQTTRAAIEKLRWVGQAWLFWFVEWTDHLAQPDRDQNGQSYQPLRGGRDCSRLGWFLGCSQRLKQQFWTRALAASAKRFCFGFTHGLKFLVSVLVLVSSSVVLVLRFWSCLHRCIMDMYCVYRKSVSVHGWTNHWRWRPQGASHRTWSRTRRSQQAKYVAVYEFLE